MLSRREFLGLTSAAVGLWMPRAWAASAAGDALSPFEREHVPALQVPAATRNGAKVPIVVTMAHPISSDHYVTSIQVANNWDPVPLKGTFHLTPANGRVYLAFQARMHHRVKGRSLGMRAHALSLPALAKMERAAILTSFL